MKPVTIANTFATQSGPIPLSQLDTNFATLAAAINDFATFSNYLVDSSGVANTITVATPAGTTFAYSPGEMVQVQIANTNTLATVNLNVNGLGPQQIVVPGSTVLGVGQLVAGQIVQLIYDGTFFQLMTGSNAGLFASGTALNPSIAFQLYPNTGIYNSGSNAIGFTVAGTQAGFIDAFGHWQINAPTAAGSALSIQGAPAGSSYAVFIQGSPTFGASNGVHILAGTFANDFPLAIATQNGSTNLMTVSGNGTVNIAGPVGINGNIAPGQDPGWGSPTNPVLIPNFPGGAASLAQCSEAIARLIIILKNFGLLGA